MNKTLIDIITYEGKSYHNVSDIPVRSEMHRLGKIKAFRKGNRML